MTRRPSRRRAGFSLAEALVVLAITSTLLILLFSVATRATGAGFRLADRALVASDRAVGTESLRVLLRGVRLPGQKPSDPPFLGADQTLQAAISPLRSTACTGAAPTPAVRLQLVRTGERTRLVCASPDSAQAVVLLDLGPHQAAFFYALAGRGWGSSLTARARPPAQGATPTAAPPPARLWIRLATDDGGFELIEAVDPPPAPPSGALPQ